MPATGCTQISLPAKKALIVERITSPVKFLLNIRNTPDVSPQARSGIYSPTRHTLRQELEFPPKKGPKMPTENAIKRARHDAESGKSPSTQAGEFVREEIHH